MVWADPVTQMVGVMCPAASEATHNVDYNLSSTKTPDQIAMMREAGKICAQILQELTPHVKPGVTSQQINDIAHDLIVNTYGAEVDREDLSGYDSSGYACISIALTVGHTIYIYHIPKLRLGSATRRCQLCRHRHKFHNADSRIMPPGVLRVMRHPASRAGPSRPRDNIRAVMEHYYDCSIATHTPVPLDTPIPGSPLPLSQRPLSSLYSNLIYYLAAFAKTPWE
jgi:hypothetical protein